MRIKLWPFLIFILLFLLFGCHNTYEEFKSRYAPEYLDNLLVLAKKAIMEHFKQEKVSRFSEIEYGYTEQGLIVRLTKAGFERGCIAFYRGVDSLEEAVAKAAINAAFFDDRFTPVTEDELKDLELEVSIIGELEQMENPYDYMPGIHTLRIEDYYHHALLQASIASEQNLNKENFLARLCIKAGMQEDAYNKPTSRLFKAYTISRKRAFTDIQYNK